MHLLDSEEMPGLLKGTLTIQFVRCGKLNCHCRQGELHGPYFYRVWRDGEKICKQYVPHENVEIVREACQAYTEARDTLRRNQQAQESLQRSIRRTWQATRRAINACACAK